jgi:deazaflavin-dependent oxidoreductase (nitroreductase family)
MATIEERFAPEAYCYLGTTGRRSGEMHEIEIWFVAREDSIYLLNGGGKRPAGQSDWVRNLRSEPRARVRITDATFAATARFPQPGGGEDLEQRAAIFAKYTDSGSGDLRNWRDTGVLVALDLTPAG